MITENRIGQSRTDVKCSFRSSKDYKHDKLALDLLLCHRFTEYLAFSTGRNDVKFAVSQEKKLR